MRNPGGACPLVFRRARWHKDGMKFTVPPAAFFAAAFIALSVGAQAQVSPFRVRVEQVAKSETEKFTKTQKRSLKIFVSNSSKQPAELTAKYFFFGRELKGKDVVTLDEGAKALSSKPLSTDMVESGIVTSVSEDEHSTGYSSRNYGQNRGNSGSNRGSAPKKVEASGTKILGYAVQIFQGEKMVAESYDPPSMKEQVGKAAPAPKPASKP